MRCSLLPKRGSTALTFRWLLLFAETGLKAAPSFCFFFPPLPVRLFFLFFVRSRHFTTYLNRAHPFPSVSPILWDGPAAPHGYLYTAEEESWWMNFRCVSQESERMFPFLDGGRRVLVGGCITLHTAPPGIKSQRCPLLQFPSDYLTSNWLRYSDSLLAVSNIFFFFFFSRCPSVIYNIYRQSQGPERGCSCGQSFPNHFAQLQNCIFEPRHWEINFILHPLCTPSLFGFLTPPRNSSFDSFYDCGHPPWKKS